MKNTHRLWSEYLDLKKYITASSRMGVSVLDPTQHLFFPISSFTFPFLPGMTVMEIQFYVLSRDGIGSMGLEDRRRKEGYINKANTISVYIN